MSDYPKMLYKTSDDYITIADKAAEKAARSSGYGDFADVKENPVVSDNPELVALQAEFDALVEDHKLALDENAALQAEVDRLTALVK